MATHQENVDFILDQISQAGDVNARKMFGEYALYCDGKVVALMCDDQLFVKITEAGKEFVGDLFEEGEAYPGAKPSILVPEIKWDDREWLVHLIRITADALPLPKPKKKKVA